MITHPFAYNTGSAISGTLQVGSLAVGTSGQNYSARPGNITWWMGPDENIGYVIAKPVSGNTQPTPIAGVSASVGFSRSSAKTDGSFLYLVNYVFNEEFANASSASNWLTSNGYWNSYSASSITTGFTVRVFQTGSNVVWQGSGSFNLTGLTLIGSQSFGAGYAANSAIWAIGANGATVNQYIGIDPDFPTSFGVGGIGATSNTGSTLGILPEGAGRMLLLPSGYTSNTIISGSATYANTTISGMGLYTGSYVWYWNSGSNSLTMNIG
jgi:hypothetical protein